MSLRPLFHDLRTSRAHLCCQTTIWMDAQTCEWFGKWPIYVQRAALRETNKQEIQLQHGQVLTDAHPQTSAKREVGEQRGFRRVKPAFRQEAIRLCL